jgi:hypothetical protein
MYFMLFHYKKLSPTNFFNLMKLEINSFNDADIEHKKLIIEPNDC